MKPEYSPWLSSLSTDEDHWETDAFNSACYIDSLVSDQDMTTFNTELEMLAKMPLPYMTLLTVTRMSQKYRDVCPEWHTLFHATVRAIEKAGKDPKPMLRGLCPATCARRP